MSDDLWPFPLTANAGGHPRGGACVPSAISWLTEGTLNGDPVCVAFSIAQLARAINDELPDDERQKAEGLHP
jgi:hypothetical protein